MNDAERFERLGRAAKAMTPTAEQANAVLGRRMTDAELIAALRRKPYDRAAREAADRLEELTRLVRGR